jgi:hypothetical protein
MSQMKPALLLLIAMFLLSISLPSCNKEVQELTQNQKEQNAINEIRKVVGPNSIIKVLDNQNNFIHSQSIDETKKLTLTLAQLRDVYSCMNDKSNFVVTSVEHLSATDNKSEIKSNSITSFDEFDDQLKPGLYKVIFKGPTFLYSTAIYFRIGYNGEVIGTPSATITANYYYDPYSFTATSWSTISFNPLNSISQFSISGSLSMNVGVGSLSFNVTSRDILFDLTVNPNDGTITLK